MKKIIFWTALIRILGLLIGACAKRDDDTAVTQWTVSCEDMTASGSITIGSDTASGTYLHLTSTESYLSRPATGCTDTSSWSANPYHPTGTQSILKKKIITSSTSFVNHESYYSDTACTSRLGYHEKKYSNLSVGDTVSGLDNSSGGRPTSGYRVTYKPECAKIMADTDAAMVVFNTTHASYFHIYPMTTGTEKVFCLGWACQVQTYYDIWGAGDNGTTFSIYQSMGGSAGYEPSDWDDNTGGMTYQK